jgi:hypothetical protein
LPRLRRPFFSGVGVFRAMKPAPMAGCITNQGAATVTTPNTRAGRAVGRSSQAVPCSATSIAAYAMPMA